MDANVAVTDTPIVDRVTCPRCARSVILCPCHVVPGLHGTVWVLDKELYKRWKKAHKNRRKV